MRERDIGISNRTTHMKDVVVIEAYEFDDKQDAFNLDDRINYGPYASAEEAAARLTAIKAMPASFDGFTIHDGRPDHMGHRGIKGWMKNGVAYSIGYLPHVFLHSPEGLK